MRLAGGAGGVTFFVWTKKVTKENRRPCSLPWRTRAAAPIPGRGITGITLSAPPLGAGDRVSGEAKLVLLRMVGGQHTAVTSGR